MKQAFLIVVFMSGLLSCNNHSAKKRAEPDKTTTIGLGTSKANKPQPDIEIKDESKYDQTFIEGLTKYNEPVKLVDNYLITGEDTTYFPDDLPLNKEIIFKGAKNKISYLLEVTRTNFTTLEFNFKLTKEDKKVIYSKSGRAVLGSMFFLASETDEDTETGDAYGSSEYMDKTEACWFSVRIGIGVDDNGKQRAMVNYGCKDNNKPNLNDCPTLRTE